MPWQSRVGLLNCGLKSSDGVRQRKEFCFMRTGGHAGRECHCGGVQRRLSLPQEIKQGVLVSHAEIGIGVCPLTFPGAITRVKTRGIGQLLHLGFLCLQLSRQGNADEVKIGLEFIDANQERHHPCVGGICVSVSFKKNEGSFVGRSQRSNVWFECWVKLRIQSKGKLRFSWT
jgi:hypothetical protein